MKRALIFLVPLLAFVGCSSYSWKPQVPSEMRTVSVPTFRNESDVVELGGVVTRQVLREFQREGSFRIASADEAALEVQGVVTTTEANRLRYRRENTSRAYENRFRGSAKVSVIDRRNSKVLIDNRTYTSEISYYGDSDLVAGARGASGRLAEDLARQIVDDIVAGGWQKEETK